MWYLYVILCDLCDIYLSVIYVIFQLGSDGMKTGTMNPIMKGVLRALPLIMFPVIINFPAVSKR